MIALAIAAAAAVAQPEVVAVVPPEHRLVEGVASDGRTIWVSSVVDRQILACTDACRTIATLPEGLHPLGIAWDWSRKLLWIAADCPDLPAVQKCSSGALLALSATGKLRGRLAPALAFHPGDVSASLHGIFVSDSRNGLVYALLNGRRELRAINRPGDGKSAQGAVLAASGTKVIVADYSRGIGSIDLKTTDTSWLPLPSGKPLRGVDGLVRCGDSYFGVYNGSSPARIMSIRVHPGGVQTTDMLSGRPLADPTQIAFDGKRLLVVANAGWEAAAKPDGRRTSGAPIIAIALPNGCRP